MKNYSVEIILFTTGAILMVFELTASRVLAPYLGASLFVWTSIIGIILASLSLGYYLGGKLSDKKPDEKVLSSILILCSAFILITAFFSRPVLEVINGIGSLDLRTKAAAANILLFSMPSILIGTVSPYSVKLKLKTIKNAGAISGKLYALATLGSIFGTFLGGFYLIPTFGTIRILYILAASLVLLAFIPTLGNTLGKISSKFILLISVIGILIPNYNQTALADMDTLYNRTLVLDATDQKSGEPVRYLNTNGGYSSVSYLNNNKLAAEYAHYFDIFQYFSKSPHHVLMIGGGAYSYPKYFLEEFQNSTIDVVEIDPQLTAIAKQYFNLKDDPRMHIYHEDGRTFLNRDQQKYDAILLDAAYRWSVPFQLTTYEFLKSMEKNLGENGMVIMNFVGSINGPKSDYLKAQYNTYKAIFPNVYVITANSKGDANMVQNLIIVAFKSENSKLSGDLQDELKPYLEHLYQSPIESNLPILTDDFAPVENLALQ